jgi:hypothetical protein
MHSACSRTHSLEYPPLKATVPRCLQMHRGRNCSGRHERADECDRQLSQHSSWTSAYEPCMRCPHARTTRYSKTTAQNPIKSDFVCKKSFSSCTILHACMHLRPSRADQAGSSQLHQHVILLRCHPTLWPAKAVQRGRCRTIELAALSRLQIGECAIVRAW